jgi:small conductance mechanosensitive channel
VPDGETVADAKQLAVEAGRLELDFLKRDIDGRVRTIQRLREQIDQASAEELPDLTRRLNDARDGLSESLTSFFDVADVLAPVGLEAEADLAAMEERLTQRAERLAGELQFLKDEKDSLLTEAASASDEDKKLLQSRIALIDARLRVIANNLRAAAQLLEERGVDSTAYKQLLIASTGEITEDIFEADVALGLLQAWIDNGKQWLIDNGPSWIFKLIVFVFIIFVFKLLANVVRRLVRQALSSSKLRLSQLLQEFFVSVVGKVVLLLGLLVALSQLGFQLGPLLAGLGIVGFIVGFALQDTLSNFASGMMILIYRPYDVGDFVEAGGVMGKVKQMNLVSTTVATVDNQRVVVPNSKIWGDVIRNVTAEEVRRIDMVFGISYQDDLDHAERVLREILDGHERVLDDPQYVVRLHTLGESSVDFVVRPWVNTADYWDVYWDITREVKRRFDIEGISIPFPQRDVHLYGAAPGELPRAAG